LATKKEEKKHTIVGDRLQTFASSVLFNFQRKAIGALQMFSRNR
jgi:hypothetical protein